MSEVPADMEEGPSDSSNTKEYGFSENLATMQAQENIEIRQKWAKAFQKYQRESAYQTAQLHHVTVASDPPAEAGKVCMTVTKNKEIVPFTVKNSGFEKVYLNLQSSEFVKNIFTIRDGDGNIIRSIKNYSIYPGEEFTLRIHFTSDQVGFYEQLLVFHFKKPSSEDFEVMCLLEITHQTGFGETNPAGNTNFQLNLQAAKRTLLDKSTLVFLDKVVTLETYKMPNSIKDTKYADMHLQMNPLNWENYSWRFHMLLHLEEHQVTTEIKKFNQEEMNVITHKSQKDILILTVSDVPDSYPAVLSGCQVQVVSSQRPEIKEAFTGWVLDVNGDRVYTKFEKEFSDYFNKAVKCKVQFIYNRNPLRIQHRAIEHVTVNRLEDFLFPTAEHYLNLQQHPISGPKMSVVDNPEQFKAIKHIVAGSSKPAPYLIFGPPGTGKTITLVRAIKEILKEQYCNILACAPSNSATDHLFEKILEGRVGTDKVFRLYPLSFPVSNIPQSFLMNCNLNRENNTLEIPCKTKLMRYKILVTTLQTAGRLVTGGIPSGHYTYIIVDEAGQASEPECLIPISGLLRIKKGQVVLAGDPKQLGPIVKSKVAERQGLGVSMLERLMRDNRLYKPHKGCGFNPHFVTKLLINYRSHPGILKIPNELFYDGELRPCMHLESSSYKSWEGLFRKDFPVIFHGVAGTKQRDSGSPSLYNMAEVNVLMEYLKLLIKHLHKQSVGGIQPQEIGIIAPYRKQVEKIQRALQTDNDLREENLKNILVGTVEAFQGKEFNVILLSTVQSNPKLTDYNQNIGLGFLRHEKRFNVAMTRARSLLIVIGDPRLLETDSMWNRLVHYCRKEGSYQSITYLETEGDALAAACLPSPWNK